MTSRALVGLALLLTCLGGARAMEPDPTAGLVARLRAEAVLRGTFSQSRQIQGFKRPVVSTGEFVVARDRGILWHTKTPFDGTIAMSPDRLRVANARGQAEVDLDARREPMLRTLNGLLRSVVVGDIEALTQLFEVEARLSGTDAWEMALTPRDALLKKRFSGIRLAGAAYVREVRLTERGGDVTTVTLADQKGDTRLTDDEAKQLQ
jgi:hypothetical protein